MAVWLDNLKELHIANVNAKRYLDQIIQPLAVLYLH